MFSPAKNEDKKFLLELALLIEQLVNLKQYDLAEKFGQHYLDLEEKIKTHDYIKDDTLLEAFPHLPWTQSTQ